MIALLLLAQFWDRTQFRLVQQEPQVSYVPVPCRESGGTPLQRSIPVWDSDFVYEVPLRAPYLKAEAEHLRATGQVCYGEGLERLIEDRKDGMAIRFNNR